MNSQDKTTIEEFLNTITHWDDAYSDAVFSFIAIKKEDRLNLLCGRVFLGSNFSGNYPQQEFETKSLKAGFFKIESLGYDYKKLIHEISENKSVPLPTGENLVLGDEKFSAYFNPFQVDNALIGKRISYLRITSTSTHNLLKQPHLDWELKGADTPYDSLNELMGEYWLANGNASQSVNIEVFANNVVEVNSNSTVTENRAELGIILPILLDKQFSKLGYRIVSNGGTQTRGSLSFRELKWTERGPNQYGTSEIEIPHGAMLHCVASYKEDAQHQYWLADLRNLPNARRALLEESDKEFKALRDYLFNEVKPRKTSRDFEFGVGLLLWMLGFSIAQPGATQRTTDSVDIIATSPKGNVLLIECTVGILKSESKLSNLIARTESVRRRMQNGHRHLFIQPMIVTAMSREDIKAELKDAIEHRVLVLAKEDLSQMLLQTLGTVDPDQLLEQLINAQLPTEI